MRARSAGSSGRRGVGAFLTALYTFRLLFIVFRGEPSAFVREHLHRERFEGPFAMVWPVVMLAVLSIVGGLLRSRLVARGRPWIEPVVESIPEASGTTAWLSTLRPSACRSPASSLAWRLYGRRGSGATVRAAAPAAARTPSSRSSGRRGLRPAFYSPASSAADSCASSSARSSSARCEGSGSESAILAKRVADVQTGLVRSYALALAAGLAVLAIVFIAVESPMTDRPP